MLSLSTFSSRIVRQLSIGILAVGLVATSGCYGNFKLTNGLYRWNGRLTDNTVLNSIAMIVLVIIPVYGICMLVDGLIVNSIDFWKGEPVTVSKATKMGDGTEVTLAPGATKDQAVLTIRKDGKLVATRTYLRVNESTTNILDEKGAVVSSVEHHNGALTARDAQGVVVANYSKQDLATLVAAQQ